MKPHKFILIFLFISVIVMAKDIHSKGDLLYQKGEYFLALENYMSVKPSKEEVVLNQIKIARCYYNLNRMEEAYKTYYDLRDSLKGEDIYMFANSLNKSGNYKEAIKWYYNVPKEIADSAKIKEQINSCRWAMRTDTSTPVELKPTRLADLGQSFGIQYYKDGVVFSAPQNNKQNNSRVDNHGLGFQNLYYADIKDNELAPSQKKFSSNLVFPYHVGAISFSHNYTRIYYTKTVRLKGDNSILKIFTASYDEASKDWKNETMIPFNSDSYSCAHPAVSPDNKYLYFTSDMPKGFGGKDLYSVEILGNNLYGKVTNLGGKINTWGDEMFPFVGLDNTLYFSSNGHAGFGSLDVFKATYRDGAWTDVTNMMLPINSSYDDFAYTINPNDKSSGFVSSDRDNRPDVIYAINLPKKAPLKFASTLENSIDGSPIANGKVSIVDPNTGKEIGQTISDKFGSFEIPIPEQYRDNNQPLTIRASHDNYALKEMKVPASKVQDLNNRRIPLEPENQDLPESFSCSLRDMYDQSVIADKQVTLSDKNTGQFIGQSISDSLGGVKINIPSEFRKGDQDFNIDIPKGQGYEAQNLTISMAELDYIKKRGLDLQPEKKALPNSISSMVTDIIDNRPLAKAKVSIRDLKTGDLVGQAITDENGNFSVVIPEKFKKDGTVFNIEILNYPGYMDEKLDISIYNIQKLKARGIELKPKDSFSVGISSSLTTSFNGAPISNAIVTVKDAQTGAVLGETVSKDDGSFTLFISDVYRGAKDFNIEIKKGNSFTPKKILSSIEELDKMKKDGISLTPIFNDKTLDEINVMVIPHDRKKITQLGYVILDKLAISLKNNPKVIIKLNGQTDIRGERLVNLNLSQEMAETAKKYLVSKGVPESNIIARGYGDRYVLNRCRRGADCSLTEHMQNNRIEVVVWRILK